MSQEMRQSLKILQMSTNELRSHIEEEKIRNPFLNLYDEIENSANSNGKTQKENSFTKTVTNSLFNQENLLSNLAEQNLSLKEHLIQQIQITFHDIKTRFIALYITDLLDDNGYLSENKEDIANSLNCSIEQVDTILNELYKLDPIGVYAENLADCLRIHFPSLMKKS